MKKFHPDVAEHIKKHLADRLYDKRGHTNHDRDIKPILKEIEVDIEEAKRNLVMSQKLAEAENG